MVFEADPEVWAQTDTVAPSMPPMSAGRPVVVGAGIRGFSHIFNTVNDPLKILGQRPYLMDRSFGEPHETVMDPRHLPLKLKLTLTTVGRHWRKRIGCDGSFGVVAA